MSSTAAEQPQPQPQVEALDSDEVEARLAWLASATNEEEAHLIERSLLTQTDNRTHEGDLELEEEQEQ
jgi:hypothetical protein